MSQSYRLQTPENVTVSYALAGVGSRFLATVVDLLLQAVLIVLLVVGAAVITPRRAVAGERGPLEGLGGAALDAWGAWLLAAFVLVIFLALFGYYVAFELLWNGQTPGKRLFHLRVLRDTGYPIGPLDSLIRNLVRLVDFLPAWYGVGVVTMIVDARSRRLGDIAAGTIVVKEGRRLRASELQLVPAPLAADDPPPDVPGSERLTPNDYSLLREYLLRRESLAPPARAGLAQQLAATLATRLDQPAPPSDAETWLAALAAAYRARHTPR